MAYFINRSFSTSQPERAVIRITRAGAAWVPPGPRAMDSAGLPSQRGCAGPQSRSPRRARTPRRGGGSRVRTWCGAGGFLPTEVMDLACCVRAGARMRLRPKRGWGWRAHNVFLVRDPQAGARVLLLVPHYNGKMELDSGPARPCRRLQRAAAGSHGCCVWAPRARGWRPPGIPVVTRAPRGGRTPLRAPRGADSATPAPRPPDRGQPEIVS